MTDFSDTLKSWRKTRRLSQLDLALEAEVSARHISFLETGRARPSRDMITRLSDVLKMPLSARNQMLVHAGFAARFDRSDWDADAMAPIRRAVDVTLRNHSPYPGMAVDRNWQVLRLNDCAKRLFGLLGIGEGARLPDILMAGQLSPAIENWPEVAHHTAERLRTESAAQGGNALLDRTAAMLAQQGHPPDAARAPVVPTIYRAGDLRLSLFSTIAQFGTPQDIALDDLKIELFFPTDDATETTLRALAGA